MRPTRHPIRSVQSRPATPKSQQPRAGGSDTLIEQRTARSSRTSSSAGRREGTWGGFDARVKYPKTPRIRATVATWANERSRRSDWIRGQLPRLLGHPAAVLVTCPTTALIFLQGSRRSLQDGERFPARSSSGQPWAKGLGSSSQRSASLDPFERQTGPFLRSQLRQSSKKPHPRLIGRVYQIPSCTDLFYNRNSDKPSRPILTYSASQASNCRTI